MITVSTGDAEHTCFQTLLHKAFEVSIRCHPFEFVADGEGGEVGIDPDFWWSGWRAGELMASGFPVGRFFEKANLWMPGEGSEEVERLQVGEDFGIVELQERRRDGQAQETPLHGPIKGTTSEGLVGMGQEGQGEPNTGIKGNARNVGGPSG